MSKLIWDNVGEREYETGVDKGVLYLLDSSDNTYKNGEAWNGLTGVTDSPSGAEPSPLYADNVKYLNLMSAEELELTIESYTYPNGFKKCLGMEQIAKGVSAHQQKHATFGFAYRSLIGNDVEGTDAGYKIHLVYGCLASPSESSYSTTNDSPEANTFSFSVSTTPVAITDDGVKKTASITVDSTEVDPEKLAALEKILYGTDEEEARLPLPAEVITLIGEAA